MLQYYTTILPWSATPELVKLQGVVKLPVNTDNLTLNECAFLRNIGFKIQFMRKKAGMSQAELAEKSGLADSTISHLESTSVYSISLVALYRISTALDVEPRALLDFD